MKFLCIALLTLGLMLGGCDQSDDPNDRRPDVHYVPTPQMVVDEMLEVAELDEDDVLYDLGSGDGRIPITAAHEYGIRAVGIELDRKRVTEARRNAEEAGVEDLVTFHQADLFESDISEATVVTLYLLSTINLKLRPKLLDELEPGSRVVSHAFGMGDWIPTETRKVAHDSEIYLWEVPEKFVPGFPMR